MGTGDLISCKPDFLQAGRHPGAPFLRTWRNETAVNRTTSGDFYCRNRWKSAGLKQETSERELFPLPALHRRIRLRFIASVTDTNNVRSADVSPNPAASAAVFCCKLPRLSSHWQPSLLHSSQHSYPVHQRILVRSSGLPRTCGMCHTNFRRVGHNHCISVIFYS